MLARFGRTLYWAVVFFAGLALLGGAIGSVLGIMDQFGAYSPRLEVILVPLITGSIFAAVSYGLGFGDRYVLSGETTPRWPFKG